MLNTLHSESLIIDKLNEPNVITFNPFEIMGLAFLSIYNLEGGDGKLKFEAGSYVFEKEYKENYLAVDFIHPILLKPNTKVILTLDTKAYIHYHIFTPSDRELKLYPLV